MFAPLEDYLWDPRFRSERMFRVFGFPAVGLILVLLALLLWSRSGRDLEPVVPVGILTHYEEAERAFDAGQLDEAERQLRASLAANENRADALRMMGQVYGHRGQYDQAIDLLEQAMAIKPEPEQFFARAECEAALGRGSLALDDFGKAAAMAPSDALYTNKYYLFLIGHGRAGEFRQMVKSEMTVGLETQTSNWLMASAALALEDGKTSTAGVLLQAARDTMPAKEFSYLAADPVFLRHRDKVEIQELLAPVAKSPLSKVTDASMTVARPEAESSKTAR